MTLLHYLARTLEERMPELVKNPDEWLSVEQATRIPSSELTDKMKQLRDGLKLCKSQLSSVTLEDKSDKFLLVCQKFTAEAEKTLEDVENSYTEFKKLVEVMTTYLGESTFSSDEIFAIINNFNQSLAKAIKDIILTSLHTITFPIP